MKITVDYLNQIQNSRNEFYVVTKGYRIGIYGEWELANEQVSGFSKAEHGIVKGRYNAVKHLLDELVYRAKNGAMNSDELETLDSCLKVIDIIKPLEFPSLI